MIDIVFIRHGPTAWNAEGRMQGRADVAMNADGRRRVAGWRVPQAWRGYGWVSSPLKRALETAKTLRGDDVDVDDRLTEMDWGDWEGCRLSDLRARLGPAMAAREARGLDFRPPGGESPRHVQARVQPFLAAQAARAEPCVAVSHKGVIRAVLALATGWSMTGKPTVKLSRDCAQIFGLQPDGSPVVRRLNVPLCAVGGTS